MKYIALFLTLFLGSYSYAQLTVDDYTVELSANVDDLESVAPVTAQSTCGEVSAEVTEQIFSGGCLGNLVRTYVFTDTCGNVERAQQFIKLNDTTPPEILMAAEGSVDASGEMTAVTATDNSGKPVKVTSEVKELNGQKITVYTAIDPCGNTSVKQIPEQTAN